VPKKRPWFQFHLSTAVVLMFVAGLLLGANILISRWEWVSETRGVTMTSRCYGFPMPFYRFGTMYDAPYAVVSGIFFCFDLCVWLLTIGLTAFVCEWLIRRKERKT